MTTFRVHFANGVTLDVSAATASAARDIARDAKGGGIITKVKVLKDQPA